MLFRSLIFSMLFLIAGSHALAQTRISLLTCGTGEPMYALFGHSAVRVQDSLRGTDQVYNYGVFDFDTPHFTWKFMRGKLMYKLDITQYKYFLPEYRAEGRSVSEQEVLLEEKDEKAVIAYLTNNYQPEQRYYLYDFFFDNCATRIRDVFEHVLQDRLDYHFPYNHPEQTYREALDPFIVPKPWLDLGIDLLLGAPSDRQAGARGEMFIPDHLAANLAYAKVDGEKNLLGPKTILLEKPDSSEVRPRFSSVLLLWLVLQFFLLVWWRFPQKKAFDGIFWILAGLAGCLVFFMWFGTSHIATRYNWNLLWLNPVQILAGIALLRRPEARWLGIFGWIQLAMVVAHALGWFFSWSNFSFAALPVFLLVTFQSARLAGASRPRSFFRTINPG